MVTHWQGDNHNIKQIVHLNNFQYYTELISGGSLKTIELI